MRIVRIANFVAPRSGGLKTALRHLGAGYQAAGHESVLVIPGVHAGDEMTAQGRVVTVPGPRLPGLGGYRVLLDRRRVAAVLRDLRPDRLEVSDRTTLRWVGKWAHRAGVPAMMVSHESLDGLLRLFGPALARGLADRMNARTAATHDRILCTTRWAATEFERIGVPVRRVPLGVDLDRFTPARHDPAMRARWAEPDETLLLHCGRLSPEKKPRRSLEALASLRRASVRATLVVAGAGPLEHVLQKEAIQAGLPAHFLGHVSDPDELAGLLATADVAIAPGPVETFGLAALEALASGTPVVVSAESALPEVIGDAGLAAYGAAGVTGHGQARAGHREARAACGDAGVAGRGNGPGYAAAIQELLARPADVRRASARRRAEAFPWSASVAGFLAAHETAGAARADGWPPAVRD